MAELDIGKHCGFKSCKQLDFLPFNCRSCPLVFCKEHRQPDSHDCSHELDNFDRPEVTGETSFACEFKDCKSRELIKVVCEHCKSNFCLEHRHQVDHNCGKYEPPNQRMKQTSDHVQKILEEKQVKASGVSKPGQGRKSKATSFKVSLMKLKIKAVGDKGIPMPERIYFQVHLPLGHKEKAAPMFFSHCWTIGRVIDKAASLAGLQNNNNTKGAKKLRLFNYTDATLFKIEDSLKSIIESDKYDVFNGSSVIIEYVDEDVQELSDSHKYST